ncbi:MAG: RNA polymerase sigma factor [Ignavibacteriaceae bacterium]
MKESELISSWVEEARLGSRLCLNNLITFHHADMLAYALKICRYSNIAEDALQDAYINLFIHIRDLKEAANFQSWFRTIVKRCCWQYLSGTEKHLPVTAKMADSKIPDSSLEEEIEKRSLNEFLQERITQLSEPLRIAVILRYFTDFNKYENISEILDIPEGTVRSRLNEAKKQLKKIWRRDLSGMPERLRSEADYWNEYYDYSFRNVQKDISVRNNFTEHFLPGLEIKFTSGRTAHGRDLFEKEINDDITYGTSYGFGTVFNLKDIGVIQGENINSKEYPDRCPSTSTLIFHRKSDKTFLLQFHNALIAESGGISIP